MDRFWQIRRPLPTKVSSALLLFIVSMSWAFASFAQVQNVARQELAKRGVPFSEESFISSIKSSQRDIVELFLQAGIDANRRTALGLPLPYACSSGRTDIAELLIVNGARYRGDEKALLHTAISCGLSRLALSLMEKGESLNAPTLDADTPLHIAFIFQQPGVAKELIAKGANVDSQNVSGVTPLMLASTGSQELVELLLAKGADLKLTDKRGRTALHYSLQHSSWNDISSLLISKGADQHAPSTEGWTPLLVALQHRNEEMARHFLKSAANPNAKTSEGFMPLHLAASAGYTEIVIDLVKMGADINAKIGGWTPLSFAIDRNHFATATVLISNGGKQ